MKLAELLDVMPSNQKVDVQGWDERSHHMAAVFDAANNIRSIEQVEEEADDPLLERGVDNVSFYASNWAGNVMQVTLQ